jgi:tripartite ATP-independent transporter DctM subunit
MITVLLVGLLILFILMGMPISFAIGVAALVIILITGLPLQVMIPQSIESAGSLTLLAIPLFLVAGMLMEQGGISRRIVDFAYGLVGSRKGGLGYVAVVSGVFFGGVSGSATADTAAIGGVVIPAMKRKGYKAGFAAALVAASGTLGLIIPPSVVMVILGVTANISIGDMFLGGIVPGLLLAASYMVVVWRHATKEGYPTEPRVPMKQVAKNAASALPALMTVVIIVVGLTGGVFTASEAGAAAAAYALLLFFIYRESSLADLGKLLVKATSLTGTVMLLIVTSGIFGIVLTHLQIPQAMADFFLSFSTNPAHVFLAINVLLLLLGTFLDPTPIIIILAPLLAPVAVAVGIDPVHFGVVFTVNMLLAQLSPPAGVPLFVTAGIAQIPLGSVFKPVVPFLLASAVVLVLITYVPALVMFLPNLLGSSA